MTQQQLTLSDVYWSGNHGGPFSHTGWEKYTAGPFQFKIDVPNGNILHTNFYNIQYHGGGYYGCKYYLTVTINPDKSLRVIMDGDMYNGNDTTVIERSNSKTFTVKLGEDFLDFGLDITNSGDMGLTHNGPTVFQGRMTNTQI